MKEDENKFDHIHDSGLKWALERTDRELKFEKTMIFKFCAIVFIIGILCALSTLVIGRIQLGFQLGFISVMLMGLTCIIMLIYVDLIPLVKKAYISYRQGHLPKQKTK